MEYSTRGNDRSFEDRAAEETEPAMKLPEASSAILLVKNPTFRTSTTFSLWTLQHMYFPITLDDHEDMQFLYLSGRAGPHEKIPKDSVPEDDTSYQHPSPPSMAYILTPQSRLVTMSTEYSMVFMIDLSSSLATFDVDRSQIMVGNVYDAIRNLIYGLVQPMSMQLPEKTRETFKPSICMSVIAECSQFGSNMNVVPILAEYPTMRVLLQSAWVTPDNVSDVLESLQRGINQFLRSLVSFRQRLAQRRLSSGYALDVRNEHPTVDHAADDLVDIPGTGPDPVPTDDRDIKKKRSNSTKLEKTVRAGTLQRAGSANEHHCRRRLSKARGRGTRKDVWGVGKSGSSLSYILNAGSFALDLLPAAGNASFFLLTDGVVNSSIQDESIIRHLNKEGITCNIIQVGFGNGLSPASNFGFFPDFEVLRFVSSATGGLYLQAEHMRDVSRLVHDTSSLIVANDYQTMFLFRQISLSRPMPLDRLHPWVGKNMAAAGVPEHLQSDQETNTGPPSRLFPWDPKAQPRPIETSLLRYQEYPLPSSIRHIIAARTRQGFRISSIAQDRRRLTRRTLAQDKERMIITLSLDWQPEIQIEYRIRTGLSSTWAGYLANLSFSRPEAELLDSLNSPRVEILIRTTTTFSHMLQNWDAFQRRCQVMGIVTGGIGVGDSSGSSTGFLKIGRLKKFLSQIFETDHHLFSLLSRREDLLGQFRSLWDKLDQSDYRFHTFSWYDLSGFDLILLPEHPYGLGSADHLLRAVLRKLQDLLRRWADFVSSDEVYVKILIDSFTSTRQKSLSFCEVRVIQENGRVVHIQIQFFNARARVRREITEDVRQLVTLETDEDMDDLEVKTGSELRSEEKPPGSQVKIACRPLSSLMMRDPDHYFYTVPPEKDRRITSVIRAATWRTGEFIVRNYLRRYTWHWEVLVTGAGFIANSGLVSLQQISFDRLCNARADQGYILISSCEDACHFYKESQAGDVSFSCQYYIWREGKNGTLTTELWIEPITEAQVMLQDEVYNGDKAILTKLVTFDLAFSLGHDHGHFFEKTNADDHPSQRLDGPLSTEDSLLNVYQVMKTHLFDVSSILIHAAFSAAIYPCPSFAYGDYLSDHMAWLEPDKAPTPKADTVSVGTHEYRNNRDGPHRCSCPRPDRVFHDHNNLFVSLGSGSRDIGLLHYFFVRSMSIFADYELAGTEGTSFSGYLDEVLGSYGADSTLMVSRDGTEMTYFIKIFGPSTFIVVCVPSLDAILDHFRVNDQQLSKFGLVVFECHRRLGGTGSSRAVMPDEAGELVIKPMEDTLLNGLGCAIRPDLINGSYLTEANTGLSDFRFRMVQSVSELYSRSFAKSVFTSLLCGSAVEIGDLDKVLEVCEETVLEIDLTGYLNVQSLLQRRGRSSPDEIQLAQQRFKTVLGHYFEPIVRPGPSNLYCYRPPQTKLDYPGKPATQLADILVCAHSPLFLRLDYVLRNGKDGTEITFPLSDLPCSYHAMTADGKTYNFEPDQIGTPASPVGSVDRTAASLRLVCMTLPETRFDPTNILSSHLQGCPADNAVHNQTSFLDSESKDREALLSLTPEKQNALIETKMRLLWLLTEEIMHGLLRAGPVTEAVVRYIESRLVKKNPFVDFPTTIVIPLVFVKDRTLSLRKFTDQLEKNKTPLYRLVRVGNCFYASDSGFFRSDFDTLVAGGTDDATVIDEYDEGLGISTYNTPNRNLGQQQQTNPGGHDDFCEGLGISIFEPAYPEEDEVEDQTQLAHQQLYWLLVIPHSSSVRIYFYSKMPQSVNRTEIIRVTKRMINVLLERTNKLVLLDYLNESRVCSKYLIAPDESYRYSSDDSSDDDTDRKSSADNLVDILSTSGEDAPYAPPKKFHPGQFGCEILYVHRYPLHWRLQPNTALNTLATDVMRHFVVRNRPNTFVCMQNNEVVYFTLHENTYTQYDASETQTMDDTTRASSPFGSSSLYMPYDNPGFSHTRGQSSNGGPTTATATMSSQRTSPRTSSPSKISETQPASPSTRKMARANGARELVLEVHGVELPTWISAELVEMLGNRITNQITLKEVQQFLGRNPNTRLWRADVEFILPVEKEPSSHSLLRLPRSIRDTAEFLNFLRESILSSGPLRVLLGSGLASALRRHRQHRYYASQRRESTFSIDEPSTELCFYYNCANRVPGMCTEFEQSVGEGVAGIILLLCDKDSLPDSFMAQEMDDNNVFEKAVAYDSSTADQYIAIDIWTAGQIEVERIYSHVYNAFRQAICDTVIEASVMDASATCNIKAGDTLEPLVQVLQRAKEWESPTVNMASEALKLQPWCLSNIIQQLSAEFSEIHLDLKPFVRQADIYHLCNIMTPTTPAMTSAGHSESLQEYKEYVVISGLTELWGREDEPTQQQQQQQQQIQQILLDAPLRQEAHSVHSRHDSTTSSVGRAKDAQHRRCFLLLFLDADRFTVYTYNYSKPFVDQIVQRIERTIGQQVGRIRSLSNILHQKMGLFRHSEHIRPEHEVRAQKPELYTAVRSTDYNNALRDAYAEPSNHPDHLVRHGDPFLETYFRGSQLRAAHEKAFKVYRKWASRYTAQTPVPAHPSEMMTVTELKLILKTSRLLHFCRTPLMFSDGGSSSFDLGGAPVTGIFGAGSDWAEQITGWYERLAQTFMIDYATYLESIGMHLIVNGGGEDEDSEKHVSSFRITDDCLVSSPVVYLLQVYPGGTIMCQVQLTDVFASVTLYTLHRRYGRLTRTPYTTEETDAARASFQSFTEECDRFKQKIHVNSFVYDFRLRFIQQSLDAIDSLPETIHLLNVVKNIVSVYQKLPSFARNRILSKVYEIALDEEDHLDHIIPTLFQDPSKYGFTPIHFDSKPVACFVSSDDLSFDMAPPGQDSQVRYTLILAPAQESMDEYHHRRPRLQFFIIITHQGWPSDRQYPTGMFEDLLLESAGGSYALRSVVQPASRRIDRLVDNIIHGLHQDTAWNRLYHAIVINKSERTDSAETCVALSMRFYELEDVPPLQAFVDHLGGMRSHDILEALRLFYPQTSGYIHTQSLKYLLVFNSSAVLNYFVRFELTVVDTRLVKITASAKEKRRDPHRLDETEMSFIGNLALTLSYCIWKISH